MNNLIQNYFSQHRGNMGAQTGGTSGAAGGVDAFVYLDMYLTIFSNLITAKFLANNNVANVDFTVLDQISQIAWIATTHAVTNIYPLVLQASGGTGQGFQGNQGVRSAA